MARRAPARQDDPTQTDEERAAAAAAAEGPEGTDEGEEGLSLDNASAREDLIDAMISDDAASVLKLDDDANRRLLAEACFVFGINPDPRTKPLELAGHRFDAGDPDGTNPTPAYVSIVTAGGRKLRYPIDSDTETILRDVFMAYTIDKATGERKLVPLPPDMTLPREAVTGLSRTGEHQYRSGYLREGGKAEGDRRAALQDLKRKGSNR